HEGYIHVGFFEDGTPGEIFIKMAKEGSTISGLMDTVGVLTSMALQYGVPLEVLVTKFSHVRFEPSGFTRNSDIPMAKSLIDYIFRFLGTRFLSGEQRVAVGLLERHESAGSPQAVVSDAPAGNVGRLPGPSASLAAPAPAPGVPVSHPIGFATSLASGQTPITFSPQADAPSCPDCGSLMVRNGACYKCFNCGATSVCWGAWGNHAETRRGAAKDGEAGYWGYWWWHGRPPLGVVGSAGAERGVLRGAPRWLGRRRLTDALDTGVARSISTRL